MGGCGPHFRPLLPQQGHATDLCWPTCLLVERRAARAGRMSVSAFAAYIALHTPCLPPVTVQGGCEHLLSFVDVRLHDPGADPPLLSQYPYKLASSMHVVTHTCEVGAGGVAGGGGVTGRGCTPAR